MFAEGSLQQNIANSHLSDRSRAHEQDAAERCGESRRGTVVRAKHGACIGLTDLPTFDDHTSSPPLLLFMGA